MIDRFGRKIEYLRISVTDRCNLRCVYCMPEDSVPLMPRHDILTSEEISRTVRIMTGLGIRYLRITGGEPMSRKGCLDLISQLNEIPGVESISMTSNGIALCDRVHEAKEAGIKALNLSINTLDPEEYSGLTRGGDVNKVLTTLDQALREGLNVKVNAVLIRGYNENRFTDLVRLAKDAPLCVRFIELMPIGSAVSMEGTDSDEIRRMLAEEFGEPVPDPESHGHGPAKYLKYPGFKGSVGFISAVSDEFCKTCNRVRLTADGRLKLCLNHSKGLDLRALLRNDTDDDEIRTAIQNAIYNKPERHGFLDNVNDREVRCMNSIGG
ncbi:MAG: GTP 3',8-cyclase MoaA [Lachnospiraceae bacterium]|nr:GTP 3',8-cyclase MoaA [Lachnospiraceae bacterium]